jgi:hypothetical protein
MAQSFIAALYDVGNTGTAAQEATIAQAGTVLRADPTWPASGNTAYAPGSFTVATENFAIFSRRLKLTGAQRATLAGTARLRIT